MADAVTLALQNARELIDQLLTKRAKQIRDTYQKDGGSISVSLKVDIERSPQTASIATTEVSIGFITDRVKETMKRTVDERQGKLNLSEKEKKAAAATADKPKRSHHKKKEPKPAVDDGPGIPNGDLSAAETAANA